jgi:hypothetical protein
VENASPPNNSIGEREGVGWSPKPNSEGSTPYTGANSLLA